MSGERSQALTGSRAGEYTAQKDASQRDARQGNSGGNRKKVVMPSRRKRLIHHELVSKGKSSSRCCRLLAISPSHVKTPEPVETDALVERIRVLAYAHSVMVTGGFGITSTRGPAGKFKASQKNLETGETPSEEETEKKTGQGSFHPGSRKSRVWQPCRTVDFVHYRLSRGGNIRLLCVVEEMPGSVFVYG